MSQRDIGQMRKRIGMIVGREREWSQAFMDAVVRWDMGVQAELVKLSGTFMDEPCPYDVIIDRMSHEVPYYRVYLEYAALQGAYIINNPFTWSADSKFFGLALVNRLGFTSPRTIVLPNKHIEKDITPDSFRNLVYPMDWQGIIDYVGVPAIFKNINSGGRYAVHRVHGVDELIQRYDESGTLTMILQQVVEAEQHIHCFVFGHETVIALQYLPDNGRYHTQTLSLDDELGRQLIHQSLTLTRAYGYDVNMVEFVQHGDQLYVINCTNPAPVMNQELMTPDQFDRCLNEFARMAIDRAKRPYPQRSIFDHTHFDA
jgi:hypothetical protein